MTSWERTFRAVWVANLVTALGMQSFLPFFPTHLESIGVEDPRAVAIWSGVLYGAAPLSAALMGPVWGVIGDRVGRKPMILRALLAIALFVGAMAWATTPEVLLALRIGQGVFSGFIPPSITLVSVGAPADRQGRVAGSLQVALALGTIGGPAIGAALGSALSTSHVFLAVSALAAASALLVLLVAEEGEGPTARGKLELSPRAALGAVVGDLAVVFRSRDLRAALVIMFLIQFGMGATNPQLDLYVRRFDLGEGRLLGTGMLFTLVAVGSVLSSPLWGRAGDRRGHTLVLLVCAVASGAVLASHALAGSFLVLAAIRLGLGLTAAGAGPVAFGVVAAETEAERRGGAFGAMFSARALALALGAMASGPIVALVGLRALFVLCGLAIWVAAAVARPRR
jgi:DHA1 family multidrug resistance protein-like MFS transporter